MKNHFLAAEICNTIESVGGPNMLEKISKYCDPTSSIAYIEFPCWDYINEFLTLDEVCWWDFFHKVTNINPGEGFYFTF